MQQNPGMVKQAADNWIAASPKQQELETARQTAQARADTAATGKERLAAEGPGGYLSPENKARTEAQARLAVESSPQAMNTAATKASVEATARQGAAQGSAADAGHLLASGQLTLADLKSRSTTPSFITQSVAAQKENKDYNTADEVIAEHVAKSAQANQFFGSANSLISKGGTLDQLAAQGQKIPNNKLPVGELIEDWKKLATGKGPLAGYAATALGVADDYGKSYGRWYSFGSRKRCCPPTVRKSPKPRTTCRCHSSNSQCCAVTA